MTGAAIVGKEVRLGAVGTGTFDAPNGITYFATPPQVFNLEGAPADPFLKIPFI